MDINLMVLNVGKAREPSYFLLGSLTSEGWWYYHLAAFAAKTPLPALLAYAFALGAWLNGKSRGVREYALVLPVVVIFASNTLFRQYAWISRPSFAAYESPCRCSLA